MKFARQQAFAPVALQLAPMIDVIMFLLVFFLLTWNVARFEAELDIKVPRAQASKEAHSPFDAVVLNVRQDGAIILNRKVMEQADLVALLKDLGEQFPAQTVIIRSSEGTQYKHIIGALDACRLANIWNVAFATMPPPEKDQ